MVLTVKTLRFFCVKTA